MGGKVQLPLPADANRALLTAARTAANSEVESAAHASEHVTGEDADSVGYAAEMQFMAGEAGARVDGIDDRLCAIGQLRDGLLRRRVRSRGKTDDR